ncbi:MAG: Na/Pi cotransporter family protein, partial [Cyclobacteriaceae bacterium]|nr:Na/Pi cotransporter family protein [Cyclobacteriaceae bacterium]
MTYFLAVSRMLAGIGLFLLGMNFLEDALRRLGGRKLKLFLRNNTANNLKSVAGGAVISGILQGSSVVNLMVLAFVGAGIVPLKSALAISLGAGLGSTLNGWIVATVGFGFHIESFALFILGVAGLVLAASDRGTKSYHWSRLFFGFGALFVGLEFMKSSFVGMASAIDFEAIRHFPWIVFILIGFVITAIVQSSAVTTAIILSALHVDAISLYDGCCVVLGGELGTTIKLLLASFRGQPSKKRVALGTFSYNGILIAIIMLALDPIHTYLSRMESPLVALVTFHSFLNFVGIVIFLPFINVSERLLLRLYTDVQAGARYLKGVPPGEGDLALETLDKETRRYLHLTLDFHRQAFALNKPSSSELDERYRNLSILEKYDYLKLVYGEIHTYFIGMDKETLSPAERERA